MLIKTIKIRSYEVGLLFREGEFQKILPSGKHRIWDPLRRIEVKIVSKRDPWLIDPQLDVIIKSGALEGVAEVIDLKDNQLALVWIDGRFAKILGPGLYAYWTGLRAVKVQIADVGQIRFEHEQWKSIVRSADAGRYLEVHQVHRDCVGVLFVDGKFQEQLSPGTYAFWKDAADTRVVQLDLRETQLDVSGQEIMTLDKVTLRMNALVTYVVQDARRAVSASLDVAQSLYREVQLALRAVVGARELDAFLSGKDEITDELLLKVRDQANQMGLEIRSLGIKDIILPGDMKDLMNRVTEAKKAAEANLIARREETAAIRSQANSAKLLADNPTLMRLRELEVLEKIASAGKLNIVLGDTSTGEKGLTQRVVNLL